jgi:hypothetical protein
VAAADKRAVAVAGVRADGVALASRAGDIALSERGARAEDRPAQHGEDRDGTEEFFAQDHGSSADLALRSVLDKGCIGGQGRGLHRDRSFRGARAAKFAHNAPIPVRHALDDAVRWRIDRGAGPDTWGVWPQFGSCRAQALWDSRTL